jgi:endonuclease YncB( thermonuclease family)
MAHRLILVLLALLVASQAHAHGGGIDKLGCHHNRKAGGYHCHRGVLAGQTFGTKQEAFDLLKQGQSKQNMPAPGAGNSITGKPRVIDGDTLQMAGERIRLHGIDAPESKQKCTADGKEWACGQEATFALARFIETHWVTCKGNKRDRYGRLIAVCFVGSYNLNAIMVREGWAMAYRQYSNDYVPEEDDARIHRRGLWRGKFMAPWEWRKR